MNAGWRQRFIERTASKPSGEWAVRRYNEPVAHYRSFRTILEMLNLKQEDEYFEMGCGGGVLLRQALEQVSFAAGIDHSRRHTPVRICVICRQKFLQKELERFTYPCF